MPSSAGAVRELPVREPEQDVWNWPGLGALDARAWLVLWRESGHGARTVVVTFEWLAEALGRSRSSAQRYLSALMAAGLVERLCREQRGFRFRVIDPESLRGPHIARGCDRQRRLGIPHVDEPGPPLPLGADRSVENAEPISGPTSGLRSGPTSGLQSGGADFPVVGERCLPSGTMPVARGGPGAAEPCQPVAVQEHRPTDHAGARSEKIITLTKDPDPRPQEDPSVSDPLAIGDLLADLPMADGLAYAAALEAQAASLHAAVGDSELTLGFCRKVCEARFSAAPDGGPSLPRADVEKILDRLWHRRNLPRSNPDALRQPPRAFFTSAIMRRFQEINGRAWPRTKRRCVA